MTLADLRRAEARQGADPGRIAALGRGPADPQPAASCPSVSEEANSAPAGQVIRQAPSAGSQVAPGSTVSITVSKGVEKTRVPNVIGKLRSEAVGAAARSRACEPSGRANRKPTSPPKSAGSPTSSRRRARSRPGSTVTVVVGKTPPRRRPKKPKNEGRRDLRRPLLGARGLAALGRGGRPGTRAGGPRGAAGARLPRRCLEPWRESRWS